MNNIKYPYNISIINKEEAIKELDDFLKINERISSIKEERERVSKLLTTSKEVNRVYPSHGNFILVDFKEKDKIFNLLKENGIIVRDRSSLFNCSNCLRISIGTKDENNKLLEVLNIKHDTSKIINNDRVALINRKSNETNINIKLNLDKFSKPSINTGLHFFNHMLEQIGYHSGIGLNIFCDGDLAVDEHHTIEDVAIVLGDALLQALGTKENIERYGFYLPMDESDIKLNIDLGGRIDFKWDVKFKSQIIGGINNQMFEHFFKSLSEHLKCNLHIKARGENDHHIVEGIFKAFARALKQAINTNNTFTPSSKGIL